MPTVEQTDERVIIRLPRRVGGGLSFLLAFPLAGLFLWMPAMAVISIFFPSWIHSTTTVSGPSWSRPIGYVVLFLFFGGFVVAGVRLILINLICRFGHGEIHLWRGRVWRYERLGFVQTWSTRPIETLMRLNIEPAEYARQSNIENEQELMAFFGESDPFAVAHHYNREQLLTAAKQLQRALPQFGAAAKITIGPPPPLRGAGGAPSASQPSAAPQPKGTRIKLERSVEGGMQLTIPGFRWWAGLLPAIFFGVILSYLLFGVFNSRGLLGQSPPYPRSFQTPIECIGIAFIVTGMVLIAYVITRDIILHANNQQLTMTTTSFLGTQKRQWAVDTIDRLEVEVEPNRGARGGGSAHCLTIIPKKGRRRRYFSTRSAEDLNWMRAELSAAMWPRGSTQYESGAPLASTNLQASNLQAANLQVRRPPRLFGVALASFSCIFLIAGWWCAIAQNHRLRHGQPVQATVTQFEGLTTHGKNGAVGYNRILHYQYSVAGRPYQSTELFPVDMSGQAESTLRDTFYDSLGGRSIIPAWYVDDDPSRSYLIHERSFSPYLMIVFANLFFLAGLVLALPPKRNNESRFISAESQRRGFITLTWLIMGLAAIGHYLLQWPTRWHVDFLIIMSIWIIISSALIVWWRKASADDASASDGSN
ncbi:MAG: DUF3592 domain-containing protein [Phycisphaerae bacterium]|nr:DUF3592 domain-containing protein [Phycisphaerae bacterium]